jgi:hypothetical protein
MFPYWMIGWVNGELQYTLFKKHSAEVQQYLRRLILQISIFYIEAHPPFFV